jgi:cardiolipin synthase
MSAKIAVDQTEIRVYPSGSEFYQAVMEAIAGASSRILIANFCFESGEVFDQLTRALLDAVKRNITVSILADAYGSRLMRPGDIEILRRAGIDWAWFRPLKPLQFWTYNHRMHKKLVVVDDRVGFTGGIGFADFWVKPYQGYPEAWRDTHFRLEGPVVTYLLESFQQSWNAWSGKPVSFGPSNVKPGHITKFNSPRNGSLSAAGQLYLDLINQAEKSITITTAYFGPPGQIQNALADAASRGVAVRLLLNGAYPSHHIAAAAGRYRYQQLLQAGAEIFEYQPTKIHAKLMTVDQIKTTIGSANLNMRSAYHDEEFNLLIENSQFSQLIENQFEQDIKQAKKIMLNEWEERSLPAKLGQKIATAGQVLF